MTSAIIVEAKLFWWLLIGLVPGLVGAIFTNVKYYKLMTKPMNFTFPPWLFGIVWTILYALQATAVMLFQFNVDNPTNEWSVALTLYLVAFFVGNAFMPVFFAMRSMLLSAVVMFSAWGLHLGVLILFFEEHLVSGWLMLPTQIWLTIATFYFLNLWYLNPK